MATSAPALPRDPASARPAAASPASPSAPKKPKYDPKRAWAEARALIWEHRKSVGLGLLLMLISRPAGLVLPAATKWLIDEVLVNRRSELLVPIALASGAATLIQAITSFSLSQVVSVAAQQAIAKLREDVQAHLVRLPVRYFDSTKSGVLVNRVMNDPEGIRNLVGTGVIQLVGGVVSAIMALSYLLWLNWRLTAVMVVFLAVFGAGMAVAFRRLRPIFRERSVIQGEVTGRLTETIGGIRVVKVYTAEQREREVFRGGVQRLFDNIRKTITGTSATTALGTAIVGAVGTILMVLGGRDVIAGRMTLGDLVTYTFFVGLVAAPLISIASIGTQLSEALAGLDRIRELKDMATEDQLDASKSAVTTLRGDVAFENVWFSYEPGVPVLKGISFVAPAGTTTALVGSSGSGKSTLISLIMAFAQPEKGVIRIDGSDLGSLKLRDYRGQLGVVLQDNFLFDGTVRDNIAFTRPGASAEQVEEVARIAHVDEFVSRFPDGYDTIVGERGVKLSGGQRQRVAIARAILADPRVLILDEATSSLDSESEQLIQAGLRRLRAGRTTFVIAHRLSTITSADQILVIEEGEIVERGTHGQLIAQNGRYKELYDRQHRLESDQFINPGEDFTTAAGVR
ncbi:MAG: ABC transporter ATP-binding protein/permease [Gemmatimonadaceae bacterium]|jgi:subfamily B ATP-binding cassette protein MsbA|nr:ABC transporter ATP-binding protein/permease [Gemmatimonadaceae bacterium]